MQYLSYSMVDVTCRFLFIIYWLRSGHPDIYMFETQSVGPSTRNMLSASSK